MSNVRWPICLASSKVLLGQVTAWWRKGKGIDHLQKEPSVCGGLALWQPTLMKTHFARAALIPSDSGTPNDLITFHWLHLLKIQPPAYLCLEEQASSAWPCGE
jgi:hypothetical protein